MSAASSERQPVSSPVSETKDTTLDELVIQLLGREKRHPVSFKVLRREIARRIENQPEGAIRSTLARLVVRNEVLDLGAGGYFLARNIEHVKHRICEVMAAHHANYPFEQGMPTREIRIRFSKGKTLKARRNIDSGLFDLAMSACKESGVVVDGEDGVRLARFSQSVDQQEASRRLEQAVIAYVGERRYYRIDLKSLSECLGVDTRRAKAVFARLLKAQEIIRYGEDRYIEAEALDRIKTTLEIELSSTAKLTIAEIKALFDIPRNAIVPLLEYLDDADFTRRDGAYRTLAAPPKTS